MPKKVSFPSPVLRVRVRREGNDWSVDQIVRVPSMTLPASVDLPDPRGRSLAGFWFELRDGKGEVLYRRALHGPAEPGLEVPGDDGQPHRVTVDRPDVIYEFLVPDLDDGRELQLFSSAADRGSTFVGSLAPTAVLPLETERPRRGRKGA